jgi:hypothetical protein
MAWLQAWRSLAAAGVHRLAAPPAVVGALGRVARRGVRDGGAGVCCHVCHLALPGAGPPGGHRHMVCGEVGLVQKLQVLVAEEGLRRGGARQVLWWKQFFLHTLGCYLPQNNADTSIRQGTDRGPHGSCQDPALRDNVTVTKFFVTDGYQFWQVPAILGSNSTAGTTTRHPEPSRACLHSLAVRCHGAACL